MNNLKKNGENVCNKMNFIEFAELKGLKMLKDDIRFVRKQLYRIPKPQKRIVMIRYIEEWQKGMVSEIIEHKKQNKGRFRANQWLLLFIF